MCDREGCREDLGEGGWPRSSWKLWRCWAAALGIEGMRREGVLVLTEAESMLERGVRAGEGGLTGGSRVGVDILLYGINRIAYSSKQEHAVEAEGRSQLDCLAWGRASSQR